MTIRRLLLLVLLLLGCAPGALAQEGARCFPETGHCIEGRIRSFWERNGGLPVFGFPIGPQQEEVVEGRRLLVQWFERNRLELHPENPPPYDVLLGRVGAGRLAQQGRDWRAAFPASGPQRGCRFFPETGHSVCGRILQAWRASGLEFDGRRGTSEAESLALFGLPLSGLVREQLGDGRTYQVQWFERARFELHPENPPPYDVLLGLLGAEARTGRIVPSPAAPPPTPLPQAGRPGSCLNDEEAELVRLVNAYRAEHGLPPVPVSRSLTTVAQLHVRDLQEHSPNSGADPRGLACNLHSWSANGPWTPVCYTADHAYATGMWEKPREITGYPGIGFENAFAISGAHATAASALASWKGSAAHRATILQQEGWSRYAWPAMGVGISESFAVLWFGDAPDPQGEIGPCR
ncbi:MAG TPA: CAP domain-containing protein [Roseiflexaceae bacterium]|nr:CAP domain-containing protein [Roseiflexaceae bacterium]